MCWLCRIVASYVWLSLGAAVFPAQAREQAQNDRLPPQVDRYEYSHDLGDRNTFGVITAVAAAGRHAFAVLDAMNSRVNLFSVDGTLISQFGQKGRGPGEFFLPTALVSYGSDVLVLDRGNVRLVRLEVLGDTLILKDEVRIPLSNLADVCTVGDRIFLAGFNGQHLIHEIDVNGEIVNSFGSAFPNDPTGGDLSGIGRLACSAPLDRVAYLSRPISGFRLFNADGDSLWAGKIPGFVGQEYEFEGAVMRPLRPSQGFTHSVEGFQWLEDGQLFVQLRRTDQGHSYLHDSRIWNDEARSWTLEGPRWPTVLLLGTSLALFKEEAPYPLIKAYHER